MFICQDCGQVTNPREKAFKKVVEVREREYHYKDKDGKPCTSKGHEVVKEVTICKVCNMK